jgi:hypothetical protein
VYDVLSDDCRFDVANKNVGDIPGDAMFMLKDKYLSYACPKYCKAGLRKFLCGKTVGSINLFDCANPESVGNLVTRKIELEVWDEFGTYKLCNELGSQCKYTCAGAGFSGRVGRELVEPGALMGIRPNPLANKDVDYWAYNTAATFADGKWYSLEKKGEGKYWRNPRIVKAINADCQGKWLQHIVEKSGGGCFESCRDLSGVLDETSECYAKCFFDTALGNGSSHSVNPVGGLGREVLIQAWAKGFGSDDMSQGGCPPCPASGPCPKPSAAVLV